MTGKYQGELTEISGQLLRGWVWCPDLPDKRVVVEIWQRDINLGVAVANVYDDALYRGGVGDGAYGFFFRLLPAVLVEDAQIRVCVANTDFWLGPELLPAALDHTVRLQSQVFGDGGLRLSGWALSPSHPDVAQEITILAAGGRQWQVTANRYMPRAAADHQWCGFEFSLPLEIADGQLHQVRLTTAAGEELDGSPVPVACFPQGDAGYFEAELAPQLPPASAQLFLDVLQLHSHYAPHSIGFEHYHGWFELFGAPREQPRHNVLDIAVLIVDGPDQIVPADCDYVALVMAADRLAPWALAAIAGAIEESGTLPGVVYTDCDQDDADGQRSAPWFKPAFDADLLCQQNYLAPLCVIKAGIARELDAGELLSWPYQAAAICLRNGCEIKHLPLVCYHRAFESSSWEAPQARDRFAEQIRHLCPVQTWPLVSIIIPTRDHLEYLSACLASVRNATYTNIEIIVVNNQSERQETLEYLSALPREGIKVMDYDAPFNYSAINNWAVEQASGEVICLLNNDVEIVSPDWLERLLQVLQRPDVGVVGARLLWRNDMVQHGGVLLGLNKVAGHYGNQWHKDDEGYHGINMLQREVAAVTGACLLMEKADYSAVGGLNARDFPVNFNDVDLCLKVQQQLNKKVVYVPGASLLHDESSSRGRDNSPAKHARAQREIRALRAHWGDLLLQDPAYNPNLNLDVVSGPYQGLALPPRPRRLR